ncbi:hypothetical protein BHE74_00013219 [Ensete ventricosum]|nr:hypothetical protein BHE74_00013219 [Ensete ventricosum]
MGLIIHNRIYVCIGASPCPVIVDLVSSVPSDRCITMRRDLPPQYRGSYCHLHAPFEVTLPELLNILREAESTIKKEKSVLYIGETNRKRKASKTLNKGKGKERLSRAKIAKKYLTKDKG